MQESISAYLLAVGMFFSVLIVNPADAQGDTNHQQPTARKQVAPGVVRTTWTYKKVDDLAIQADVYRADDEKLRPVVLWIHGGALILGNREGFSRRVREPLLEAGYVLVSIDYRLAPETKLPEILSDVEDAYAWLHREGPQLFQANTERIVVIGGSAGGYLTLTAGFRAKPQPTALVAFWGYGDLSGDWYSQPSDFYRQQELVTRDQAFQGVSGPPLTDGKIRQQDRSNFYLYCRQQGLWPKEVTGFDPKTQDEAYNQFSPVRNVTKNYPPTLLIHGTNDTDVPYEQSTLMVEQFKKHGVKHRLITIPNAGHGIHDGDPKIVDQAYKDVVAFVKNYLPM